MNNRIDGIVVATGLKGGPGDVNRDGRDYVFNHSEGIVVITGLKGGRTLVLDHYVASKGTGS